MVYPSSLGDLATFWILTGVLVICAFLAGPVAATPCSWSGSGSPQSDADGSVRVAYLGCREGSVLWHYPEGGLIARITLPNSAIRHAERQFTETPMGFSVGNQGRADIDPPALPKDSSQSSATPSPRWILCIQPVLRHRGVLISTLENGTVVHLVREAREARRLRCIPVSATPQRAGGHHRAPSYIADRGDANLVPREDPPSPEVAIYMEPDLTRPQYDSLSGFHYQFRLVPDVETDGIRPGLTAASGCGGDCPPDPEPAGRCQCSDAQVLKAFCNADLVFEGTALPLDKTAPDLAQFRVLRLLRRPLESEDVLVDLNPRLAALKAQVLLPPDCPLDAPPTGRQLVISHSTMGVSRLLCSVPLAKWVDLRRAVVAEPAGYTVECDLGD